MGRGKKSGQKRRGGNHQNPTYNQKKRKISQGNPGTSNESRETSHQEKVEEAVPASKSHQTSSVNQENPSPNNEQNLGNLDTNEQKPTGSEENLGLKVDINRNKLEKSLKNHGTNQEEQRESEEKLDSRNNIHETNHGKSGKEQETPEIRFEKVSVTQENTETDQAIPGPNFAKPKEGQQMLGSSNAQAEPSQAQSVPSHAKLGSTYAKAGPSNAEALPNNTKPGPSHAEAGPSQAEFGSSNAVAGPSNAQAGPSKARPGTSQEASKRSFVTPLIYSTPAGLRYAQPEPSHTNPRPSNAQSLPSHAMPGPSSAQAGPSHAKSGPSNARPGTSKEIPKRSFVKPLIYSTPAGPRYAQPEPSHAKPRKPSNTNPGTSQIFSKPEPVVKNPVPGHVTPGTNQKRPDSSNTKPLTSQEKLGTRPIDTKPTIIQKKTEGTSSEEEDTSSPGYSSSEETETIESERRSEVPQPPSSKVVSETPKPTSSKGVSEVANPKPTSSKVVSEAPKPKPKPEPKPAPEPKPDYSGRPPPPPKIMEIHIARQKKRREIIAEIPAGIQNLTRNIMDPIPRRRNTTMRVQCFAQKMWLYKNMNAINKRRNQIHSPCVIESTLWDLCTAMPQSYAIRFLSLFYTPVENPLKSIALPQRLPLRLPASNLTKGLVVCKYLFFKSDILTGEIVPQDYVLHFGFDVREAKFTGDENWQKNTRHLISDAVLGNFEKCSHSSRFCDYLCNDISLMEIPPDWNMIFFSAVHLNIEFPKGYRIVDVYGDFTVNDHTRRVRKVSFLQNVKHKTGFVEVKIPTAGVSTLARVGYEMIGIDMKVSDNDLRLMIVRPAEPDIAGTPNLQKITSELYPGLNCMLKKELLFTNMLDTAETKLMKIELPVFHVMASCAKLQQVFDHMTIKQPFMPSQKTFSDLFSLIGRENAFKMYCLDTIHHAASLRIDENLTDNCFPTATVYSFKEEFLLSQPFFFAVLCRKRHILLHGTVDDFEPLEQERQVEVIPNTITTNLVETRSGYVLNVSVDEDDPVGLHQIKLNRRKKTE